MGRRPWCVAVVPKAHGSLHVWQIHASRVCTCSVKSRGSGGAERTRGRVTTQLRETAAQAGACALRRLAGQPGDVRNDRPAGDARRGISCGQPRGGWSRVRPKSESRRVEGSTKEKLR